MTSPLRALIVDDSADDTELLLRELRRGSYDPVHLRVDTAEGMLAALSAGTWDIVFSDFTMLQFSAFDALAELRNSGQDIPFIIISGTVGEDRAVTAMKAGAHDYILKGNLHRLVPAVERELRQASLRAQRKQAEEALQDAEARYRLLFEQSPDAILLVDVATGQVIEANERAWMQLGYTREEFAHLRISDYEALEKPEETTKHMRTVASEGRDSFDTLHRMKTGEIRNVHVWTKTIILSGRRLFYAIFQDMTERTRENALLHLQSAALNAAANAMIITDRGGQIEWVNPAFSELTGYAVEEAIGKNPRELVKSGAHDELFFKNLWDTILSGHVWRGEITNRRKDGSLYLERETITPVRDTHGEIAHFIAVKRDLTEEKELEAQFLQAQKMESVGRLAGGIAHDFNNLLNVINGTAVLALEQLREDDPLRGDLNEIRRAGERAASLTSQLLAMSRRQILKPEVVDLSALVTDMRSMLQRLISEDIELVVVPAKGSCAVQADPGQVEQVVMNLAVNARDAMPTGGTLRMETQAVEVAATDGAAHAAGKAGPYVLLTVSDSGFGMDEATRMRIFEPFFTGWKTSMQADADGFLRGRQAVPAWRGLAVATEYLAHRLRDTRFWYIQLLVAIGTISHYSIEEFGYTDPLETMHNLTIMLYLLPLLYAALTFGWEGAIFTAIWAAVLTSPSTWIWHHSGYHWFSEVSQLFVTLSVGIIVAWRVDRETEQRRRAETTSAELALLNEIGGSLSYAPDVERELPLMLRRLADGLSCTFVWICLSAESEGGAPLILQEPAHAGSSTSRGTILDCHRELKERHQSTIVRGKLVAVSLLGEDRMLGSLGGVTTEADGWTAERLGLLTTIAAQVGVALENARLYRERQESLQSYVRQVTQAQEEERRRIARDLHDETAQELVQLTRKLEELRRDVEPALGPSVDHLLAKTRDALSSVRRFSRDLRPSVLDDLGLVAALETTVEEVDRRLPQGARVEVVGTPRRVDLAVEVALFRIGQEALRNVEKHARAKSVAVGLVFADDLIRLSVTDDGDGFTTPANAATDLPRRGKLGLVGMRERAELVGASFDLQSAPGLGTRITVDVPQGRGVGPASPS